MRKRLLLLYAVVGLHCSIAVAAVPITHAVFPYELRGTWDEYPTPCKPAREVDSDTRMEIEAKVLRGYENNDSVQSVEQLSAAPPTWRVVTVSDVAPAEVQGEADIYVLRGDVLTITNGERSFTHIRCR